MSDVVLRILQGNEKGQDKPFDRAGGEHAIHTGFARALTGEEMEEYEAAQAVLRKAAMEAAESVAPVETADAPPPEVPTAEVPETGTGVEGAELVTVTDADVGGAAEVLGSG